MLISEFKAKHPCEVRAEEAMKNIVKFPDRVPIFIEYKGFDKNFKNKFLVPRDLTIGQFMYVIRKKIQLKPEEAVFLFFNKTLAPNTSLVGNIYDSCFDPDDHMLYGTCTKENVFG